MPTNQPTPDEATAERHREEWKAAERAIAAALGFRIVVMVGAVEGRAGNKVKHPDSYLITHLDSKGKVRATRPCTKATYDAFQEAVKARLDHDKACSDLFNMYCAAMGIEPDAFDGLPGPDPVAAVKSERSKLLSRAAGTE